MSSITFRKCYPEHILYIQAQAAQRSEYAASLGANLGAIVDHGEAWSGWVDNRCVVAGGIMEKWRGTGFVWSMFGVNAGPHMLAITRQAKATIANSKHRRLEITTLVGYKPATRWAVLLGFRIEAFIMPCYDPDGRDMALWGLVRNL